MTTIAVKPAPTLARAAWPLLKHPASGGLLDAAGQVPADGRPWLDDGFTARMLTDGAIVRAEADASPGFTAWAADQLAAQKAPPAAEPDPAR